MVKPEGVPSEIYRVLAPPEELERRITAGEQLCGGRFTMIWQSGPLVGRSTTSYCIADTARVAGIAGLVPLADAPAVVNVDGALAHTAGYVSRGVQDVVAVETTLGYRLLCTPDHRLLVWHEGALVWREASALNEQDRVVLSRGYGLHGQGEILNPEIARLMGLIDGDGSLVRRRRGIGRPVTLSLQVDIREPRLIEEASSALEAVTGQGFIIKPDPRSDHVALLQAPRRSAVDWAMSWGLKTGRIAPRIFALAPQALADYLSGLFEADGTAGHSVEVVSAAEEFARDVQQALLSLGILSRLRVERGTTNYAPSGRELWHVRVLGAENRALFDEVVGFAGQRKTRLLAEHAPYVGEGTDRNHSGWRRHDDLPIHLYQRRSFYRVRDLLTTGQRSRPKSRESTRHDHQERRAQLAEWVAKGYHFGVVQSVTPAGVMPVGDILESPTERFVADGFVVHNCATPGCLTTGYCTGPRFVPHPQQSEPDGTQRRVTPGEVVPAARKSALMALGKDDPRSDREIRAYVAMIYSRMKKAYQGRW